MAYELPVYVKLGSDLIPVVSEVSRFAGQQDFDIEVKNVGWGTITFLLADEATAVAVKLAFPDLSYEPEPPRPAQDQSVASQAVKKSRAPMPPWLKTVEKWGSRIIIGAIVAIFSVLMVGLGIPYLVLMRKYLLDEDESIRTRIWDAIEDLWNDYRRDQW